MTLALVPRFLYYNNKYIISLDLHNFITFENMQIFSSLARYLQYRKEKRLNNGQ